MSQSARSSLLGLLVGLLLGCTDKPGTPAVPGLSAGTKPGASNLSPAAEPPGDPVRGRTLVERFECNRCHQETGLPAAAQELDCVACHRDIEAGTLRAPPEVLARWRGRVHEVAAVPSLAGVGNRFKRSFLTSFLLEPWDIRPHLAPTMPRLPLARADALDIVAYFAEKDALAAPPSAAQPGASAERGQRWALERGCPNCHAFSGLSSWPASRTDDARAFKLAPDLRFARERLRPELVADWLLAPARQKADTSMPPLGLGEVAAADVARFVLEVELDPLPPRSLPERLPLLTRPVSFQEVNRAVFAVTCRHCHADPDEVLGDGGPGNSGGFGFAPRRVDFASHRGILSGGLDEHGRRASLFRPEVDGTPRLVAVLLARQAEEAGAPRAGLRGMPLGLPALGPTAIQLVESWIAQGRPL